MSLAPRPLRRRDELAVFGVLVALAALTAFGGWAWRLDRLVYDLGLTVWQRPPPPGIVIVAIDDASVEAIGRWPWPRAVHATLLTQLAAAKPRAVALDLVLSEPDNDPRIDTLLARALAAMPVVVPVAWQLSGGSGIAALEPVEPLRSAVRLGAAESVVDADSVLRHAFLHAGPDAHPYPHLALALLQAGGESASVPAQDDPAPHRSGWGRSGRFLIRFAGPPGSVERVSYVDLLRGAVPAERLAGRYVLIGMTAQGLGDTLATPVNGRHQAMPGIEVLANTLYTLRSGDTLTPLSDAAVATLSASALGLLMLGFARWGARTALPLALGSVPLALALSLLALRSGTWCSPVPYMMAALLAYPLWSWRRLERTVTELDDEIARLDKTAQLSAADPTPGDALESRLDTLQRAGALVREARRFLADALAAMPTAMLVGDAAGRVVLANPKAAALFELESEAELQGLDLARLLGEFATQLPLDWAAAIEALDAAQPEIAVEARLGDAGHYVVHLAAVDLQGLRRRIVTIADVEPVKRAEREREEVLAFVSHDLRSPASSIVLLADMHLAGQVEGTPNPLLHEVRRLARRTLEMSEDFVRAAQVQSRPLQRRPENMAALVDEALADLNAHALSAGVTLAAGNVTGQVEVDRGLVVRALSNLVSNAIKHSPAGSAVELQAQMRDGWLSVAVRDHGPGLTPEQLVQLAAGDRGAEVKHARGVGLGLLFVQRVAARHGGRLRAGAPASGSGALFELEFPAASGNP